MSLTPAIVIELIRPRAGAAEVKFRRSNVAPLPLRIANPDQRITTMRNELPSLLNSFRQLVLSPDIDLDTQRMKHAVAELRNIAYYIVALLVRGSGFTASDFARALADYLHPVLVQAGRVPLVEFLAPEGDDLATLLPVEFFPIPSIRESELLAFLGFQAVVVRRRAAVSRGPSKRAEVPIHFFAHVGGNLMGVTKQENYFQRAAGLKFEKTWPVRGCAPVSGAVAELAGMLVGLLHDRIPGSRKIAHFHCHYAPGGLNPDGHFSATAELDFGNGFKIPIPSLVGMLAQTSSASTRWVGEILVFLNACQTSSVGGIGGNLVEHLLASGFRHIIGSETLIPDRLAAYFAELVYEELLAGNTLGIAVHHARRTLVELHGNPGGVMWTIFGDPDLQMRSPAS